MTAMNICNNVFFFGLDSKFLGLFHALCYVHVFNREGLVTAQGFICGKVQMNHIAVLRMYKQQQNNLSAETESSSSARLPAMTDSHVLATLRLPAVCLKFVSMATDQTVWLQHCCPD